MEVTGQVLGVEGRQVNTKRGPGTVYSIKFSDGQTYDTWIGQLAGEARDLSGQTIVAEVEVVQNGQYTNYRWNGIKGPAPAQATTVATPNQTNTTAGIPIVKSNGGMDPEREAKIVRQSSLATAFRFTGDLLQSGYLAADEAEQHALALAERLYNRVFGKKVEAETEAERPKATVEW